MEPRKPEAIYPLSPAQQGMLLYQVLAGGTGAYFEQCIIEIEGRLEPESLAAAWRHTVARHAALRTFFLWERRERPLQVVMPALELALPVEDWRHLCEEELEQVFARRLEEDKARGFRLDRPPLLRFLLLRLGEERWRLLWSFSHLLIDGWSVVGLAGEVFAAYDRLRRGEPLDPAPAPPFKSYIDWLERQDKAEAESFFRRQLGGLELPSSLPFDADPGAPVAGRQASFEGKGQVERRLPAGIAELARQAGVTSSLLVHAAWAILLQELGGIDAAAFGSVIADRPPRLAGIEEMAGLFINAVPLAARRQQGDSFRRFLSRLQDGFVSLARHAYCQVEEIGRWLGLSHDSPLFESLLVYQNFPPPSPSRTLAYRLREGIEVTNHPLALYFHPQPDDSGTLLRLVYDRGRFGEAEIARLGKYYDRVLGAMAADLEAPVEGFELLDETQRREVLALGSGEPAEPDAPLPAFRAFEERARQQGAAPALEQMGRPGAISYAELDAQSSRLARHLIRLGLGPGEIAMVALERCPAQIVALLAVHKAGAAYLPVEPGAPAERLRLLAEDSGARLLLAREKTAARLGGTRLEPVALDALADDPLAWPFPAVPAASPELTVGPRDPAYLIYTSGSTGMPKGVLVEHGQLAFYTRDAVAEYGVVPGGRLLQFASLGFDTSAEEVWPALAGGATLVLRDDEMIASPRTFLGQLSRQRISLLNLPTAYWHELCAELDDREPLPESLEGVIIGGEAASPERLERWLAHPGNRRRALWNTYGPTETTIVATRARLENWRAEEWDGEVPIGRPLAGTRICVVDRRGHLRPPGLPGELWIAGPAVARGYLGRPAATAAAFAADPFAPTGQGGRLYRSGDLAILREDGQLLFRGRADAQLKIRGYRVEPGEVEACLLRQPGVKDATVGAFTVGGVDKLVAHFVAREGALPSAGALRAALEAELPEYMVPSAFVALPALPKTPSGKLDRRALPPPGGGELDRVAPSRPPQTPTEKTLAGLWQELLAVQGVGLGDDFFQLGGHSLLIGRLTSRLRQSLGIEVSLLTVFENPRLEDLAAKLDRLLSPAGVEPAVAGPSASGLPEDVPRQLGFAQERLYFLYRLDPSSPAYNIPAAWRFQGELDMAALARSLGWLERRHPALRTRFFEDSGLPLQVVEPPAEESMLPAEQIAEADLDARLRQLAEEPFDIHHGRPWRAALLEIAPGDRILFLCVHHICFDGLSYLVAEKELAAAYAAYAAGREPALAPPPYSYADFADWQRSRLTPELASRQLEYWRRELDLEPLELPSDRPRPKVQSFRGALVRRTLPAELALKLEERGRTLGATAFLAFLAGWLALASRLAGQRSVAAGVPFAGRGAPGGDGLLGFFVGTQVLGAKVGRDTSWQELVLTLRAKLAAAFAHGDLPFERLVAELTPQRDSSRNPLFQVGFQLVEADPNPAGFQGLAVQRLRVELRAAKFDLELMLRRLAGGGIEVEALYAADLLQAPTVDRWLELYEMVLRQAAEAPELPCSRFDLLRPADQALYAAINDTTTAYGRDFDLISAFAEIASAGPELVAVEHDGATATYFQLDERANRLARRLRNEGATPGAMVGVCLPRGIELVVAILSIVKTGAAYVPLDADYPAERLAAMAADTGMAMVVAGPEQRAKLPSGGPVVLLFGDLEEQASGLPATPLEGRSAFAESPAYVIFTSGSTGRPKGVVIPHRGVLRLVRGTTLFSVAPGEVVAQVSTASFDAYTIEMWGALLSGGRLLVIGRETQLEPRLFAAAIDRDIALLPLNAAYFARLVLEKPGSFRRARQLFFGGEASEVGIVRRAITSKPRHLKNTYGPTECTMLATAFEVPERPEELGSLPIGKPISNTDAWVLDRDGALAPLGAAGELCLGGDGLAWGYAGRPALTAAAFVPHPFSATPGARLYRSGDLARLMPSGELEYLGRIDFQVKVRGFRIELGEIESVLGRHEAVREKIALTRGAGADQQLLAFVVAEPGITAGELQDFCADHLPAYSVPRVILVSGLPRTPTGKIDRASLASSADLLAPAGGTATTAPRSELEKAVAAAFAEVLGMSPESGELGLEADFFALGGHSLLATRLIARLRETTGIELPVRALFAAPTVEALAAAAEAERAAPMAASRAHTPVEGELSFAQQRLYFLHRFSPSSAVYNLPAAWRLRGKLDRDALAAALTAIEKRQAVLRTRFRDQDGEGRAETLPVGPLELVAEKVAPEALEERLADLAEQPFDLLHEKPWRVRLLELGEEDHVLFVVVHHIAFDGLSLGIFERELGAFYRAFSTGPLPPPPLSADGEGGEPIGEGVPPSGSPVFNGHRSNGLQDLSNSDEPSPKPPPGTAELQLGSGAEVKEPSWSSAFPGAEPVDEDFLLSPDYAQHAARQRAALTGSEMERQLAFWRGRVDSEPLELPADRPRPPLPSYRGGTVERLLDPALVAAIETLGRAHGATPNLAFLAPYLMLLARLSGQRKVSVGVPFSGRHSGDVDQVIGFFVNTLVLSASFADEPGLARLLPRLRADFAQVFAHQDLPFEKLVEDLGVPRDPSRNPLFQATFQLFEGAPEKPDFGLLAAEQIDPHLEVAKFDLELVLERTPDGGLRATSFYAADLFDASTVAGWLELYEILLRTVAAAPELPLSRLPLLRGADHTLYTLANNNATAFPRERNLLALFAERVAEGPKRVAAEFRGEKLTYRELDRRTNRLARRLRQSGAGPGSMVGVCIERGIDLIAAILAIVKTGAAYVPLDADYPAERLAGMAEDAAMPLILAGPAQRQKLAGLATPVLALAEAEAQAASLSADSLPAGVAFPESAANVIFTSGSTGRPKGVVVTHRGVLRLVRDTNYISFQPGDVVVQASSASFDVYTFEMWGALINGGCLLVVDRDTLLQPPAFAAALEGREIAALFLTVTLFGQMVAEEPRAFLKVRHLFFGGEACEPGVVRRALENPPAHLQNGYGPTECTCYATVNDVREMPAEARSVPIGRPVANTEALVIDRFGQVAPAGVHGELCLGGDGLAWGYWRRPALTAAAFVPHPASREPGARLYRTGDLARLLPSGEFDYLGRIDFQVKVRGFRIELGEIETVLGRHPAVREKIALTRGAGADQLLIAFVTVGQDAAGRPLASAEELQQFCASRLPAFAVPLVRVLGRMPLTANGKIDRRVLPAEDLFASAEIYEAPREGLESEIAEIWAEVLKVPPPGRQADFFALGGHSLAAMRILSALKRRLGFELPLPLLFTHPVLADFAAACQAAGPAAAPAEPALPRQEEGPWPLSFAQERMWLLDQMSPGGSAFNMPFPLRLRGNLDADLLERALAVLEERHESLRTIFPIRGGTAEQEVLEPGFRLRRVDFSALPAEQREKRAAELRDRDAAAPFDLEAGPLFRATLVHLADGEYLLLPTFHHAIFDGWSSGLFFRELGELLAAGRQPEPREPGARYRDFAAWQRKLLQDERLEKELAYWRHELEGAAPLLALPLDRARPPQSQQRGAFEHAKVGADMAAGLRRLAAEKSSPLFPLLLCAWQVLLHRLSGQEDILVGIPSADRPRVELENTIGLFLNTLVIRNRIGGDVSFGELLAATRDKVLAAREHQLIPFEKLVLELQPERSTSQSPFFQVLFNFANLPDQQIALPGLEVEAESFAEPGAKVDLNLYVFEDGAGLHLQLVYDTELFDRARMKELLRQYVLLLGQAAESPEKKAGVFSLRSQEAARHLPDPREASPRLYRRSIVKIFLEQAASRPNHPAIEEGNASLTYGELAERTASLAAFLRESGIEKGEVVAIWSHRGADLAASMLGVLRAGAAFLILDPAYPAGRLAGYFDLAKPCLLLTLAAAGPLPEPVLTAAMAADCPILPLERIEQPRVAPIAQKPLSLEANDLAYVAFTSGSTGRPKAILGEHGSLAAFLPAVAETFGLGPGDRHSMASALAHDPLQRDVFISLGLGMTLVVPDGERLGEPGYLANWARERRITVMNLVPALLQVFCREAPTLPDLRRVLLIGDVLHRGEVDALYALAPNVVAINLYGATETQRALSYSILPRRPAELDSESDFGTRGHQKASLPLGRGYDGVQLVLLNPQGEVAGVGEAAEIHIRSRYLARGYSDPAQTAERFIGSPWSGDPHDRLYKTGDLGRYLPDGQVEFLGRADFQVQVRGYRVELGEIEAALARLAAVEANVVVVRGQADDQKLVAYLVPRPGARIPEPRELRAALLARLPDYMVPATFVTLAALPLNQNGKIDRLALPPPPHEAAASTYRPPANFYEEAVAHLWEGLLGHERISADADFFELGGHSLLATRLLARLRDAFGVQVSLRSFFAAPTVAALAAKLLVRSGEEPGPPPLEPARRGRLAPLSFAQQRLWFLHQLEKGLTAYLLCGAMRLSGPLDRRILAAAFDLLIERHEALRTRIETRDGEGRQAIDPPSPLELGFTDLRQLPEAEREPAARAFAEEDARTPLPLDGKRLLRVHLLQLEEEGFWLVMAIHHIVADGWSLGILFRELGQLYRSLESGRPPVLPPLPVQPADVAIWERSWLEGAALERQLDFWRRSLEGAPAALELPTDFSRPAEQSFRGERLPLRLPAALAGRLRLLAREHGATFFMVLLAAYQLLLARLAGQNMVVVGIPVAHREHTALEGLIGFFANTLPLRLDVDPAASFAEHLAQLRRRTLDAFAHQDLPFEKLVAELGAPRDLSRSPIFQASFALQNLEQPDAWLGEVSVQAIELDAGRAQFDIAWAVYDPAGAEDEDLEGHLEWNRDLFARPTAERLAERLLHLLEQVAAAPRQAAGAFELEVAADRRLRHDFNSREPEIEARLAPPAIADSVRHFPNAVAIGLEGEQAYTYAELWRDAGRLARRLETLGAGPEKVVGLSIGRVPTVVVAQLATWLAGAAYLPLDPFYPAERLAFMFEDSGAEILIVDSRDEKAPAALLAKAGKVVDLATEELAEPAADWRPAEPSPSSLAYVLYTSGSTGKPKGVLIEHGSLANFLASMARRPGLGPSDRLFSVTTFSFDIAGLEIWLPLTVGARVDLARRATTQDADLLSAALEKSGATVMQATPATWRLLLDGGFAGRPGLKAICGGEALPLELAERLRAKVGRLFNVYGPTETTVWSTAGEVEALGESGSKAAPLGSPIANTSIRILDGEGRPAPPGVAGELCIGGQGLARGYHRRPAVTAEKFRPDPFAAEPGGRLYHTGDLARLRLDGELEFLGRLDFQVKVRGFRIELGEIEAALEAHPAVAQAAVVARGESNARLVAYYRTAESQGPQAAELQEFLRRGLPDYMVPAFFVALDVFPLTPNAKVDRRALPAPETNTAAAGRPPEGPKETLLAAIWQRLLKVPRVGAEDNFFGLGGDSILVIQVVARARAEGLELRPRDFFLSPTLAALAREARELAPAAPAAASSHQGVAVVGDISAEDLADLLGSDD
jgi:amino acid adenylation domain-containing protein